MAKSVPIPKSAPGFKPHGPELPAGFFPQPHPSFMAPPAGVVGEPGAVEEGRSYGPHENKPYGPHPAKNFEKKQARKRMAGRIAKVAGIGALGLIGAVVAKNKVLDVLGRTPDQLRRKALEDLAANQREADYNLVLSEAKSNSYQDSIQQNLQNVQRYAPDLYMAVAAGRRLPQGAVVLGGEQRQDLLNELGRAMADGRFSQ